MRFDLFGRKKVDIIQSDMKWKVFILGADGKRREANDIIIPSTVKEDQLIEYLDDLLHEWATNKNNKIYKLE